MGLISISNPQYISKADSVLIDGFVIVAHTDTESISLYYSGTDSSECLLELLTQNDVSDFVAKGILKATGMHMVAEYNGNSPSSLAENLPGIHKPIKHPITGTTSDLYNVIMNLNDVHKWKREDIADWIENVCDTKDITFQIPEGVKNEKGVLSADSKVVIIKSVLQS